MLSWLLTLCVSATRPVQAVNRFRVHFLCDVCRLLIPNRRHFLLFTNQCQHVMCHTLIATWGRNVQEAKRPWGQPSRCRVVQGTNCLGGEMVKERNVQRAKRSGSELSWGRTGQGAKRLETGLYSGCSTQHFPRVNDRGRGRMTVYQEPYASCILLSSDKDQRRHCYEHPIQAWQDWFVARLL